MGSPIETLRYVYDSRGNRKTLIDQDGGRFTYTYDAVSRINEVRNPQGDRTSYSYDDAGRRTLKKMANGTRASFTYDADGNLTKLYNLKSDGTVLSSFDYAYDKVGNRTSVREADGSRVRRGRFVRACSDWSRPALSDRSEFASVTPLRSGETGGNFDV